MKYDCRFFALSDVFCAIKPKARQRHSCPQPRLAINSHPNLALSISSNYVLVSPLSALHLNGVKLFKSVTNLVPIPSRACISCYWNLALRPLKMEKIRATKTLTSAIATRTPIPAFAPERRLLEDEEGSVLMAVARLGMTRRSIYL